MATYNPGEVGVEVQTEQGGIQSVSVGLSEKVVLFGEPEYAADGSVDGNASAGELVSIASPLEANTYFGEGSELAEGMQEALQNGTNLDFLRAVAPPKRTVTDENPELGGQTGQLDNVQLVEDTSTITFTDDTDDLDVKFRYTPGPESPSEDNTVLINPLTGQYAADAAPTSQFSVDYEYIDYQSAFNENAVRNYVSENETGVFFALTDSDAVSSQLNGVVNTLRNNYKLVSGFTFAEPNGSRVLSDAETTELNGGAEPRYLTSDYDESANQSVVSNSFFKPAPARVDLGSSKTIGGGLAGLYAGNPISDAIYNEAVSGYNNLEQSLNRTEASDLRGVDLIPVRDGGSVRVKGNRATNFGESGSAAADFFTRRITDRVILVIKQVGDAILGQINNPETRGSAQDAILRELGSLAQQGLIKNNEGSETNYVVEVFESSTDKNEVVVNVSFTPFGIVKKVDASVTVNV